MLLFPLNFGYMQGRAALLASLEGWTDVIPAPDWGGLVNQGWLQYAWDSEAIISNSSFVTVATQANYSLTESFKKVTDVVYGFGTINKPMSHSTEDFERYANPAWRVQTPSTPTRFTFAPFNNMTVVPPPLTAGVTINVRGVMSGDPMVNSTDTLPIPDVLVEAVCVRAAMFQGVIYAQSGGALERYKLMETRYDAYVKDGLDFANFESEEQ